MSQTPLMTRPYVSIFDQLVESFRGPSTGLSYADLVNPIDTELPALRPAPKFVPRAIANEAKIDGELTAVAEMKTWPDYASRIAETAAEKAQQAMSVISVKERRGIALVETPHHFKTQAEKDAETNVTDEGLLIPPMPTERPKLSLVKTTAEFKAPTREERLGLDRRSGVKTLAEKAVQVPVDFHKGVLDLAEEKAHGTVSGPYRGIVAIAAGPEITSGEGFTDLVALANQVNEQNRRASLIAEFENPTPFSEEVMKAADTALRVGVNASYRAAASVPTRIGADFFSGLHAAAERVRNLGADNPPMHPQDAANYDATFGGKYMQAPVEYVGSDTVEMALPMKE